MKNNYKNCYLNVYLIKDNCVSNYKKKKRKSHNRELRNSTSMSLKIVWKEKIFLINIPAIVPSISCLLQSYMNNSFVNLLLNMNIPRRKPVTCFLPTREIPISVGGPRHKFQNVPKYQRADPVTHRKRHLRAGKVRSWLPNES